VQKEVLGGDENGNKTARNVQSKRERIGSHRVRCEITEENVSGGKDQQREATCKRKAGPGPKNTRGAR